MLDFWAPQGFHMTPVGRRVGALALGMLHQGRNPVLHAEEPEDPIDSDEFPTCSGFLGAASLPLKSKKRARTSVPVREDEEPPKLVPASKEELRAAPRAKKHKASEGVQARALKMKTRGGARGGASRVAAEPQREEGAEEPAGASASPPPPPLETPPASPAQAAAAPCARPAPVEPEGSEAGREEQRSAAEACLVVAGGWAPDPAGLAARELLTRLEEATGSRALPPGLRERSELVAHYRRTLSASSLAAPAAGEAAEAGGEVPAPPSPAEASRAENAVPVPVPAAAAAAAPAAAAAAEEEEVIEELDVRGSAVRALAEEEEEEGGWGPGPAGFVWHGPLGSDSEDEDEEEAAGAGDGWVWAPDDCGPPRGAPRRVLAPPPCTPLSRRLHAAAAAATAAGPRPKRPRRAPAHDRWGYCDGYENGGWGDEDDDEEGYSDDEDDEEEYGSDDGGSDGGGLAFGGHPLDMLFSFGF
eukprot:tig00001669_g9557.t2